MLLKCVRPVFTENDEAKQSRTKSWACLWPTAEEKSAVLQQEKRWQESVNKIC